MQITIIITGVLILFSAFTYSVATTFGRTDTIARNGTDIETVRETMLMMNDTGMSRVYSDGTYETSIKYEVPYGYIEPLDASITITGGVVTWAEVGFEVGNPVSSYYQKLFQSYFKDEVVGKSVDEVSLARIGGASHTNVAFDVALEKIKAEASGKLMTDRSDDEVTTMQLSDIQPVVTTVKSTSSNSIYVDGIYVIENSYYILPELSEPMRTTITIKDGLITDVSVVFATVDYSNSLFYQQGFTSLYKEEVIGLPLNETPVSRIGNASLTTNGFNDALQAVKAEAQKS